MRQIGFTDYEPASRHAGNEDAKASLREEALTMRREIFT
jgi:hypothetical protein